MTAPSPAGWLPDPFRRHQVRYWSGLAWTEHVATHGVQSIDPPAPMPQVAPVGPVAHAAPSQRPNAAAVRDVQRAGILPTSVGGGSLLTEPVLVVSQKAKLIEVNAEYAIYDQHGRQVGRVREVGQNLAKKMAGVDQHGTKRLQILDALGGVLMTLTRPVALLKSTVTVRDSSGGEIGQIRQKNLGLLGRVDFALEVRDEQVGAIKGEDWNSWNFSIEDGDRNEVARVGKSWAGWAKESLTKKDNYVVEIQRPIEGPLRSLVVASALVIDTVLRQHDRRRTRW